MSVLRVEGSSVPRVFFGSKTPVFVYGDLEYTISARLTCVKDVPTFNAICDIYMSGSAFPVSNPLGVNVHRFTVPVGEVFKYFDDVNINFFPMRDGDTTLNFVIYAGEWSISDVDLFSAVELGFNPDEARIVSPINNRRFENLIFRVELFDPNNNIVPIDVETDPILFDGGNLFVKGRDNRLEGSLILASEGPGPMMTVDDSGSYISVGELKKEETSIRPIPLNVLPAYTGSPQIVIYSGSDPYAIGDETSSMGIQVVAGGEVAPGEPGGYLDFNSTTGDLVIKGTIFASGGTFQGIVSASHFIGGAITIGEGTSIFKATEEGIWLGDEDFENAPFSVTPEGLLSATTGVFSGDIVIGSGSSVFKATSEGIQLGDEDFASAPFRVTPEGQLFAASGIFGGVVSSSVFAANDMTFAGTARFNNIIGQTVFTIDALAGYSRLVLADGDPFTNSYAIEFGGSAAATGSGLVFSNIGINPGEYRFTSSPEESLPGVSTLVVEPSASFYRNVEITGSFGVGVPASVAVSGRIDVGNDIVSYSSSDVRFKKEVYSIESSLDKVKKIRGVEFIWDDSPEMMSHHGYSGRDIGVIAQEIEDIFPEIVRTREDGYKGVRYERLIPLLIEAIKELDKKIEE